MNKLPTLTGIDAKSAAEMAAQNKGLNQAKMLLDQKVNSEKDIEKAASGFEALLLHQMMQSMWSTVEFSGMFNESSNQAEVYRDMLNQAISDSVAEGRGIGVKDFLRKELLKTSVASK